MLMAGKQVTQVNDPLLPVSVQRVYQGIINSSALATQVQQLRISKSMDEKQYRRLKTALPYIVCGIFTPAIRRKENFRHTQYFIIDIDHISKFDTTVAAVRQTLLQDEQIMLLFASPGGDGLKALFQLKERVEDTSYYSYFYKLFAARLANRYQLGGMVDAKTCDVSRCCFMSHDPDARYHPGALPVDASAYIDAGDTSQINAIQKEWDAFAEETKNAWEEATEGDPGQTIQAAITDDHLKLIKQRLQPGKIIKQPKPVEQPEQLHELLQGLTSYLQESGVELRKTEPISYGRKLVVYAGKLMAEINIFYGKRGFSIVKTTKTGSNAELADLVSQLVQQYINENAL